MKDSMILVVGPSGCGKDTIVNELANRLNLRVLKSYTTRPKRGDEEDTHIFITEEQYKELPDVLAYTLFNGHHYCSTVSQFNNSDIYIVDPYGVKVIKENYKGPKKLFIIGIKCKQDILIKRMMLRGQDPDKVKSRYEHDLPIYGDGHYLDDCDIVVDNSYELEYCVNNILKHIANLT